MSTDKGTEAQQPDAVCFYFPLPMPLAVHDGAGFTEKGGGGKRAPHLDGIRSSVAFHQTTLPSSPDGALVDRLLRFVHELHEESAQTAPDESPSSEPADLTIAEVVVPLPEDEPLTVAIAAVQRIQKAVALATQRTVPLLTRQRLPAVIPAYHQSQNEDDSVKWDPFLLLAEDISIMHRLAMVKHPTIGLDDLQAALRQVSRSGPFAIATELRHDAQVHLHHHGDYRASVLTLAVAYEVLLDAILMSLLWEEGADPSVALYYFGINGLKHTKRVVSEYAPRLKGNWSRTNGPVADYLQHVVNMRQRVVHAGHAPTEDEAQIAHAAATSLEKHMSERLQSPAVQKRYPRTAIMYCGPGKLQQSGTLLRVSKELLDSPRENWWFAQHEQWAFWASRYIDLTPAAPSTNPEALDVLVEVETAHWRLFVVDRDIRAAAEVRDPRGLFPDGSEEARMLQEHVVQVRKSLDQDMWDRTSINVAVDAKLIASLAWQRAGDLFEDHDFRLPAPRPHGPFLLPHEATSG